MQSMESEAAATAAMIIALSRSDADFIKAYLLPGGPSAPVLVRQHAVLQLLPNILALPG